MSKPVPTVVELAAQGRHLAYLVTGSKKGEVSRYHVTAEGHALMGAAMRENAEAAIASGETAWVQPPSRDIPALRGPVA
jgi:hypothetical protein